MAFKLVRSANLSVDLVTFSVFLFSGNMYRVRQNKYPMRFFSHFFHLEFQIEILPTYLVILCAHYSIIIIQLAYCTGWPQK